MYDIKRPLFTRPVPNPTSGVPFIKLSPKYRVPRPSPPQPSPSPPVPDYYTDYEETEDLSPELGKTYFCFKISPLDGNRLKIHCFVPFLAQLHPMQ